MVRVSKPKIRFIVVTPKNLSSNQKGKFWEEVSAELFRQQGWKVIPDRRPTGMQLDIFLEDENTGETVVVECKYTKEEIHCGILRDLIGKAYITSSTRAYLLSTSKLNSEAETMLEAINKNKPIKLVVWHSDKLAQTFMNIWNIKTPNLEQNNLGQIETITLLINYKKEAYWIADEIGENGEICRVIIFTTSTTSPDQKFNSEAWKNYFSENELQWANYEVFDGSDLNIPKQSEEAIELDQIIISPINKAEDLHDYQRPCRPRDFIGRSDEQDKFWRFVENVRKKENDLRIFALTGKTGLGKSSLVVKLTQDGLEKNTYIYGIDVTSIVPKTASLFIPSAIRKSLQEAINHGFINLPNHKIQIESAESPFFSSQSIRLALDYLKQENKILILFFDQFEEILHQPALCQVFNLFSEVATEVNSLKAENFILAFSWRTDIMIPVSHQAYNTWHKLDKIRYEFDINEFIIQDVHDFINHYNLKRVSKEFNTFLLEDCPRFPWLLRKIFSIIHQKKLKPSELILKNHQNLIKQLFEKDLESIKNPQQRDCLQFVAGNKPVNKLVLSQRYDEETINSLSNAKLIIENGDNYKPYWDIFGEYLINGELPTLILSYIPRTTLPKWLSILSKVKPNITREELLNSVRKENGKSCTEKTIQNAIIDMTNFLPIEYDQKNKKLIINDERILNFNNFEIADYIHERMQHHIIIKKIYERQKKLITEPEFYQLLQQAYSIKEENLKDYKSKMLSWFMFAGLLEKRYNRLFAIPIGQGQQKGKPSDCTLSKQKNNEDQLTLFDNFG
jgi:Holliday junction resolvase-like predicted endonuclease